MHFSGLAAILAVSLTVAACGGNVDDAVGSPTAPPSAGDSQGLTADHSHEPTPTPQPRHTWSAGPSGGGADLVEYEALRACTGKPFSYWDDQPWPPELDAEEAECVEQHMVEAAAYAEATRTALDQIEAYCEELNRNAIDEDTPETWGEGARVMEEAIDAFEDITPPGNSRTITRSRLSTSGTYTLSWKARMGASRLTPTRTSSYSDMRASTASTQRPSLGFLVGIRFRACKPEAVSSNGMSATVLAFLAHGGGGTTRRFAMRTYVIVMVAIVALAALVACGGNGETLVATPTPGQTAATPSSGQAATSPSSAGATTDPAGSPTSTAGAAASPTPAASALLTETSAETDREALVALYNATGGESWSENDGWLSDAPIGEWHGVTADENGRVIWLLLDKNDLSGEIPPELGNLANLKWLNLDRNQLSGEIPPELGNLASLQDLWLSSNQLSGEIPPELGNLANLEILVIADNQLSGQIPPELRNLANLERLLLAHNQVSGQIPPELGNLANLEILVIADNQVSGQIPPELGNLASLETLYLFGNQLSGQIPPELGNFANLEQLRLDENQLSGCVPQSLEEQLNMFFSDLGGLPFCNE